MLQLFYYGLGNVVVLILLLSVIGSYYYLKIIKEIFFYTTPFAVTLFPKKPLLSFDYFGNILVFAFRKFGFLWPRMSWKPHIRS